MLLATAPSVGRVSPTYPDGDYWRFTPAGSVELFSQHWDGEFTAHSWGNFRSCLSLLAGITVEQAPSGDLEVHDPRFVLTVGVDAHKPEHGR